MIKLQNVSYLQVLNNISFSIKNNEIITIIGPNGGGKTSLLKIIAGIKKPSFGHVVKSKFIKVGYMPQKIKFNPTLPIDVQGFLTLEEGIDIKHLKSKAERVGIGNLLSKQIHHLSGGEMQKVLFVSAIINKPDILILDEPINHLDIKSREEFYDILQEERQNSSVIMSSHDIHVVMKRTEKVICINKKLCCIGHPEEIRSSKDFITMLDSNLSLYKHDHSDT